MSTEACWRGAARALAGLLVASVLFSCRKDEAKPESVALSERTRDQLELIDGRLYEEESDEVYSGVLVKRYPGGAKLTEIEVRNGKVHGVSRGWFENGQMEVEERFVDGVSHGERLRWHKNGQLRSRASIVDGKIEGTFTVWHENGEKAAEIQMINGLAEGESRAWDSSGQAKTAMIMKRGEIVETKFRKEEP